MNDGTVDLITYTATREILWRPEPDRYQYKPNGRHAWLQRICFWLLDKLQAHVSFGEVVIKRTPLNLHDLVDAVMRNRANVEMIYNQRAKYLVIGYNQWHALTQVEPVNFQTLVVPDHFNARVGVGQQLAPKIFAGLQVVVVPWIDGMFVLPELNGSAV